MSEPQKPVTIDSLPKGYVIHVGGQEPAVKASSKYGEPAQQSAQMISAGLAGIGAYTGGRAVADYQINQSLLPFDTKVAEATVKEMRELGLSGGFAATSPVATDGSGIAGGIIKERNYLKLLQQPENAFARFIHNIGGRGVVASAVGAVAGVIAAVAGWAMFSKKMQDVPAANAAPAPSSPAPSASENPHTKPAEFWQNLAENTKHGMAAGVVK